VKEFNTKEPFLGSQRFIPSSEDENIRVYQGDRSRQQRE
jgi:hypothetical protein